MTLLRMLPNLITLLRIAMIPVVIWAIADYRHDLAFWLFAAVGLSDFLDGWLARRLGAETLLGRYLDPVADKGLMISCYVGLAVEDLLPAWLVILVVFRDVVIVGAVVLAHMVMGGMKVEPIAISKANTAMQVVLVALVLAAAGYDLSPGWALDGAIWLTAALTLGSGLAYLYCFSRRITPSAATASKEDPDR